MIPFSIIAILFIVGLFVGIISSFFGVGGGMLMVPALYSLFPEMSSQTVIACSLGMIFFNNILNTYNYKKVGYDFNLKIISFISIAFIVGISLSGQLAGQLSSETLKRIFGLFMLGVLLKTLFTPEKKSPHHSIGIKKLDFKRDFILRYLIIGFIGGGVAGLTGLGGGILLVPMLSMFLSMPFKLISPYSNAIMAIGTFGGTINAMFFTHSESKLHEPMIQLFQVGNVNLFVIFTILLGSSLTSKYGVLLNEKCSEKTLKMLFIAMLLFLITKLFVFP